MAPFFVTTAPLGKVPFLSLLSPAMQHLTLLVVEVTIVYQVYSWTYNLYFHPLSRVPGPRLWAMSRIPQEFSMVRGRLHRDIRDLHEKYGDVVRVAPKALSFISPQAWTNVMVRTPGQSVPQRDMLRFTDSLKINGAPELLTANDVVHSRQRRMLAHAFSEKALNKDYQPLVQGHVGHLICQLRVRVQDERARGKVDLANWLNLTTFDVLGDLAFGETFGCLETGDYILWLRIIFESVWAVTILGSIRQFPWINWVFQQLVNSTIMRVTRDHHKLTIEKVSRRLAKDTQRGDFVAQILKHNGSEKEMSRDEIMSNANMLIAAGSETTAAGTAGCLYQIVKHPGVYRKVVEEIRTMFEKESDIVFESVEKLEYLDACINESLRLYPPIPIFNPRIGAPEGTMVLGILCKDDISLGLHHWSIYHCSRNFTNPDIFDPSRWLGNPIYETDRQAAFHPFGIGSRVCIGKHLALAQVRTMISRLLFNFDLELYPESNNWIGQRAFWTWERLPMWVQLKERKTL
ncbi:cytochrome P450 [Xylariaceae sp. AK1471]|nr:cytochrome P450 [Xylariaceae sp. AK1471]